MVQRRNIGGLEFHGVFVILFRFFEFSEFVPAESSVIKSLEVLGVNFDSILVILNGIIKLLFLSVSKASIVVEVSFRWLYLNG